MRAITRVGTGQPARLIRLMGMVSFAFLAVGIFLWAFGKNPVRAYGEIFQGALGSTYGLTELLVKMTPFILCASATALPARIGLINVGAEGQLHTGALIATWGALTFGDLPRGILLPFLVILGFAGGAIWGSFSGALRTMVGLNETISTLLLNYVAVLLVEHYVHGPWKDPASFNWPFTAEFTEAARLPTFGSSRVHFGLVFALTAVVVLYLVLRKTRWGYEMRVIGDNAEAARRAGIPIGRYIVLTMFIGGGLAGLAGMAEVSAIQGRLRPGISTGFGYTGFLVSWLASHHPIGIVIMAFLLGVLALGGDMIQINLGLPYSTVNIIMALIFFIVLGSGQLKKMGA
ncbi:MAG: ABC transporter permease [candidate division NC10 bacterium]|nr:ABC transporter permease [candidate division NC10 bacterium]